MSVNVQMVEQLNQKAKTLNSTRERMLGQQEAARTAYEKAVLVYKQKYGVELDDTNLQQEFDAVKNTLNTEYEKLNNLILSIESGEYKNNATAVEIPTSTQATPKATPQMSPEALAQTVQATQAQQPPQFGAQPEVAQTQPQQAPANPAPAEASQAEGEDVSEQPFTPAGWGTPQANQEQQQDINNNFQNILNGGGLKFGE